MPNTPYQHIVLDYYVERLRQLRAQRRERLDRIRTPAQARTYQRRVLRHVAGLGRYPRARLPARPPRSRPHARRPDRQFGRRHP
jgi:hypothetical protein